MVQRSEITNWRRLRQQIAADGESDSHQNDRRQVEPAGAGQGGKARENKQIQRELEVMVDGSSQREQAGLRRLGRHSF